MTLNIKWKKDMMALNAKLKTNNGSKCQTEDATLNVELKINNGFELQTKGDMMTLNAMTVEKMVTLNAITKKK